MCDVKDFLDFSKIDFRWYSNFEGGAGRLWKWRNFFHECVSWCIFHGNTCSGEISSIDQSRVGKARPWDFPLKKKKGKRDKSWCERRIRESRMTLLLGAKGEKIQMSLECGKWRLWPFEAWEKLDWAIAKSRCFADSEFWFLVYKN